MGLRLAVRGSARPSWTHSQSGRMPRSREMTARSGPSGGLDAMRTDRSRPAPPRRNCDMISLLTAHHPRPLRLDHTSLPDARNAHSRLGAAQSTDPNQDRRKQHTRHRHPRQRKRDGQESGIAGDPGAEEAEPETAVELGSQRHGRAVTHEVGSTRGQEVVGYPGSRRVPAQLSCRFRLLIWETRA